MTVRLEKPWLELSDEAVGRLGGELGVYEIGDAGGTVLYIGYAGGRATFGLRGALQRHLGQGEGRKFRVEVNMQYMSRWNELLAVHLSDHGGLPPEQGSDVPMRVGRVNPASGRR